MVTVWSVLVASLATTDSVSVGSSGLASTTRLTPFSTTAHRPGSSGKV
jgi:hypothetical protein